MRVLATGAHPDDVELSCGGVVAKLTATGHEVCIVDFTEGEMGSRGTVADRYSESEEAMRILRVSKRVNLQMPDGFFEVNEENLRLLVAEIREFRPDIILANAENDRHPDHGRGAELAERAAFLSGLNKFHTTSKSGNPQDIHRVRLVLHYIQYRDITPDVAIDISDFFDQKMDAIRAYKTQFYDPKSNEPLTPIATEQFMQSHRYRASELGRQIGVKFAEGFTCRRPIAVHDLSSLL